MASTKEYACCNPTTANQCGNLTVTLSDGSQLTHLEIMPTVSDLDTCMGVQDIGSTSNDSIQGPLGPYPSSTVGDKSISALTVNCGGTGPENLSLDMWTKDMGVVTLQNLEQLTYNHMMTCIGHHNSSPAYIDADGQCATMAPTFVISNRMTLFNDMSDCQQGVAGQCDCISDDGTGTCSTTTLLGPGGSSLPRNQLSSIDIAGTLHYCANHTHPKSKTILTPRMGSSAEVV